MRDPKQPKSPQQKKALSYAHDRRNAYGENDKGSRKTIPKRKAGESRGVRRKARQSLGVIDRIDETDAAATESSLRQDMDRVGGWTKVPDMPLGDFVQRQLRRRTS